MKKIIILLLALLMSACAAVKPAENLSSMQTEPTVETTVTEPTATPKTPAETVKEEKLAEIPQTVEMPPESITEPPKAEFDVNYWVNFAKAYALQIGLEIDPTAVDCLETQRLPTPIAFTLNEI